MSQLKTIVSTYLRESGAGEDIIARAERAIDQEFKEALNNEANVVYQKKQQEQKAHHDSMRKFAEEASQTGLNRRPPAPSTKGMSLTQLAQSARINTNGGPRLFSKDD